MIKYILKCHNDHEFESWFSNSGEFDKLNKKSSECIFCSSRKINKSIMSPMIASKKNKNENFEILDKDLNKEKDKLLKLRKYIEENFDYVGKDFSKKLEKLFMIKKIKSYLRHYNTKEREELKEEGIDLVSIPWVDKNN